MTGDIQYRPERWNLSELELGYSGRHVQFEWKSFERRTLKAQADYMRLTDSILKKGIVKPLITFKQYVLIGMRRAEIGKLLKISQVSVWRIMEDIEDWGRRDLRRFEELKDMCGKIGY